MRPVRRFFARLLGLLFRRRAEKDMAREIAAHLSLLEDEFAARGIAPNQARLAALRAFGGVEQVKELHRDERSIVCIEQLLQDVRHACRSLVKSPGFTAIAILSLACGIGVNTAIFSLVDQMLLWSVPARDSGRLVIVEGGRCGTYPFYREYHDRNQVFSHMLAASRPLTEAIRPEGSPAVEVGYVSYVSGSYFQTLGVGAAAGRVLTDSDDRKPGGSQVVLLSEGYWRRRFAGSLNVIGRKLAINGYPLEIVGIAEKGFSGLSDDRRIDAFIPLNMYPLTTPASAPIWNTARMDWLDIMARLKPGVSIEKAQAGMRVLWPQIVEAVNDSAVKSGGKRGAYTKEDQIKLTPGVHGISSGRREAADPLTALMAATGLVLLIACANIANLLLARGAKRRKEIAVRMAIGATRARLVRQIVTESLVLAAVGGAAGFALAHWSVQAIAAANLVSPGLRLRPSLALTVFSAGLTLLTGLVFGLVPALRITRLDLARTTKDGGSSSQGGSRVRLGKILIAGQAALSLALLVGAGLFIRTLRNLENVDLGFQREKVVVIDVDAAKLGYKGHRLRTFYDQLLERTRRLENVRAAGLASMTPMGGYSMAGDFSAEGYHPRTGDDLFAYKNRVTEGYFTALGIPVLLGRDFRPRDEPATTPADNPFSALGRMTGSVNEKPANASRVCIVNESLARKLFGSVNAVGRHLSFDDKYTAGTASEIVGVVKDVRHSWVGEADRIGIIYTPSWSEGAEARWLVARIPGQDAKAIAAIRRELRELDPNVPLLDATRLEDNVSASFSRERMIAYLCGSFGVLALMLAAAGLYGVMAYAVAQRTREVGIRMALGAQRSDVVRMIVREALFPVLCGIFVGTVGALGAARVVGSLLFGIAPHDPLSFVLAASAMLAVALAAGAIPARRASRVETVVALRHE